MADFKRAPAPNADGGLDGGATESGAGPLLNGVVTLNMGQFGPIEAGFAVIVIVMLFGVLRSATRRSSRRRRYGADDGGFGIGYEHGGRRSLWDGDGGSDGGDGGGD